eukprot:SAG31_NODE_1391_length_8535_cov_11.998696_6_plen_71_part_00
MLLPKVLSLDCGDYTSTIQDNLEAKRNITNIQQDPFFKDLQRRMMPLWKTAAGCADASTPGGLQHAQVCN